MHYRSRSSRWRKAFAAACLPYLVVSVLVDFLHVDRPESVRVSAVGATLRTHPAEQSEKRPDYVCPACNLLRTSLSLASRVLLGMGAQTTATAVAQIATVWPDRPVPHPAALRGPPSLDS